MPYSPSVPDWVSSLKHDDVPSTGPKKIGFEGATLKWNSGKQDAPTNGAVPATDNDNTSTGSEPAVFELTNLTIDFPIGKLSVVSGPTGAGKTAILVGLLGEMDVVEGKTFLPKHRSEVDSATGLRNSVSYSAQTPWLQQKSIKENILFGELLDQERYDAVVEACALRTDFDILEDGDATEIGDKGVSSLRATFRIPVCNLLHSGVQRSAFRCATFCTLVCMHFGVQRCALWCNVLHSGVQHSALWLTIRYPSVEVRKPVSPSLARSTRTPNTSSSTTPSRRWTRTQPNT